MRLTEHEADYFSALLRAEAAKLRETIKLMETIATTINPPPDLPEASHASHSS